MTRLIKSHNETKFVIHCDVTFYVDADDLFSANEIMCEELKKIKIRHTQFFPKAVAYTKTIYDE